MGHADDARVGTLLRGKYHLDHVLGVGGMATVYAATHRNRKRFAVKMLHPELSVVPEVRARFLREGYVANTVDHPGAVSVIDDDVAEDGSAYLVMELLDGSPLDAIAAGCGGTLPLYAVLRVADQLLDVLSAAHSHDIVHRDLKPANLFLTRDGVLKVLDFGIARLREAATGRGTQAGVAMGTPGFMPREQALGNVLEIDARTDIWAAAATLFNLLTGQLPHAGDTAMLLLVGAASQPARSLADVQMDAPRVLVDILDRALAADRELRFRSASELRSVLRDAHQSLVGAALPVPALLSLDLLLSAPAEPDPLAPDAQARYPGRGWSLLAAGLCALGVAAFAVVRATSALPSERLEQSRERESTDVNASDADHGAPSTVRIALPTSDAGTQHTPPRAREGTEVSRRKTSAAQRDIPRWEGPADAATRAACARMLERQSLGETLSREEAGLFARQCRLDRR